MSVIPEYMSWFLLVPIILCTASYSVFIAVLQFKLRDKRNIIMATKYLDVSPMLAGVAFGVAAFSLVSGHFLLLNFSVSSSQTIAGGVNSSSNQLLWVALTIAAFIAGAYLAYRSFRRFQQGYKEIMGADSSR